MMASRRLNKRQTNLVLAISMGMTIALAVAFFVIAIPQDIFEAAVSATGLPAIFAGAQPPLGNTARLIIAAFGAGLAGVMVFTLFLLTDRQPARKPEKTETGSPFFADFDLPAQREPAPAINIPTFKRPATAETEAHPIETVVVTEIAEPIELTEVFETPVVSEPEPAEPGPVEPEPVEREGPIFLDFKAIRAAAQPSNDPAPLDLGRWTIPVAEEPFQSRPITAPAVQSDEPESISHLMARLEAGLERRSGKGTTPAQAPAIDRSGVGLKSTLDELRKMAVRR